MTDNQIGEKIVDSVTGFLKRILGSATDEVGAILSDRVRLTRFNNQIKMLAKAEKICKDNNVSTKAIPIKLLFPLLENASLDDDEFFQDKWANMLVNMLDSEQNYNNHVFPHILGQISIEDFSWLEKLVEHENDLDKLEKELRDKEHANILKKEERRTNIYPYTYDRELTELREKVKKTKQEGFYIPSPESDNLHRLGLIIRMPPSIVIPEFEIGGQQVDHSGEVETQWHTIEAEYEDDHGFHISELGEMFIEICKEKTSESDSGVPS